MSDTPTTILDEPIVLASAEGTGEVQKIDYSGVTAGKATTLAFDGDATGNLAAKAALTAAEVQQALEDLETIPDGGVTVSGATGGPFTVVFDPAPFEDDNVPTITATAAEGAAPVITVVSTGVSTEGPPAVVTGTGAADARERTSPLTGESPAERREAHGSEFGD
jgi:hypothetical protein